MKGIKALFFDVGGVLLTNGWDTAARKRTIEHFSLDAEEMEQRLRSVSAPFERGEITLADYLEKMVFYQVRPFCQEEFWTFMKENSQKLPDVFPILEQLDDVGNYRMAMLNNESMALNHHRIQAFHLFYLTRYFSAFFSSCFLRVRKPEPLIFEPRFEYGNVPSRRSSLSMTARRMFPPPRSLA